MSSFFVVICTFALYLLFVGVNYRNHDLSRKDFMKQSLLLLTWLLVSLMPALAGPVEKTVRIDILGTTSQPTAIEVVEISTGGKTSFADWAGADRQKVVLAEFPATNHWQQGSITIKPASTGRIGLALTGPYVPEFEGTKQLRTIFAHFDNFSVTAGGNSVSLNNGSFENVGGNGTPQGWMFANTEKSNPPVTEESRAKVINGDASDGDKYVRVWHNSRAWQGISVEAGVPVTITFFYRIERGGQ